MKRPQTGAKYICIKEDGRGFTKGTVYKIHGFDLDDDVLIKSDYGMPRFFVWNGQYIDSSLYITTFFKPCKIYLGGE